MKQWSNKIYILSKETALHANCSALKRENVARIMPDITSFEPNNQRQFIVNKWIKKNKESKSKDKLIDHGGWPEWVADTNTFLSSCGVIIHLE